jgi:hypothetical protein
MDFPMDLWSFECVSSMGLFTVITNLKFLQTQFYQNRLADAFLYHRMVSCVPN